MQSGSRLHFLVEAARIIRTGRVMRKQLAVGLCLLSPMANAADQLPPPLLPPPPVIYNWTGIYIGTHAGYGWGRTQGTITSLFPYETVEQNLTGGLAGAHIGINHQMGRAVLGVELSGSWNDINGSSSCIGFNPFPATAGHTSSCNIKQEWSAQLVARFGYVPGDGRFFPYLLGGIALTQLKASLEGTGPPVPPANSSTSAAWGSSKQHQGGLIGVGLQYAFSPSLSVGVEYMLAIYGSQDHGSRTTVTSNFFGAPAPSVNFSNIATPMNLTTSTARLVINYTFQ
jgi:outer membrane immunogenic protein